jgi:hypothetical protein
MPYLSHENNISFHKQTLETPWKYLSLPSSEKAPALNPQSLPYFYFRFMINLLLKFETINIFVRQKCKYSQTRL